MREIKFRAWEIDWKNNGKKQGRMIQWEDIRDDFATILSRTSSFILMQFTGLYDKNGKEIYEGDILSSDQYPFQGDGGHNYAAEVIFEDGAFHAVLTLTPGGAERVNGAAEGNSTSGDGMSDLEVIGDIYSTPEILS